ncbi:ATP-binding protein [Paraburkholderia madseniana]|uniref:ATP-binding protein n=1 Tax=Paraburkholderia madseniana TaxID=2599607 RepID=UPI0038B94F4A
MSRRKIAMVEQDQGSLAILQRRKLPPWVKEASYYDGQILPEHKHNEVISTLGAYFSDKEFAVRLASKIEFEEVERQYSPEYRLHAVARLQNLRVVRPANIKFASDIHRLIRSHLTSCDIRNNGLEDFESPFGEGASGETEHVAASRTSDAYCIGVFGISGVGKTSAAMSALMLWPQVYLHRKFGVAQVVWLKIECPKGLSLKETLIAIIGEYDRLLGTYYSQEVPRGSTWTAYANKVACIARKHFTGLIVLDEIQFALNAARKNDPLLDFFVYFLNRLSVPLLMLGTPRAEILFAKTFYLSRRGVSGGVTHWTRITSARDWDTVCSKVWEYQWLHKFSPLDEALKKYLLNLTAGILGVFIPLFQLTQYRAIRLGGRHEKLTADLFHAVLHEEMSLVVPMLEAIRSGKAEQMAKFDDILSEVIAGIKEKLKIEADQHQAYEELLGSAKVEALTDAVSRLLEIGVPQERAYALVTAVQEAHPNATSKQLYQESARRLVSGTSDGADKPAVEEPKRGGKTSTIM